MKIHVHSEAGPNALKVFVGNSLTPDFLLHSILGQIPVRTRAMFNGSRWNSMKHLKQEAHHHGMSVYRLKT